MKQETKIVIGSVMWTIVILFLVYAVFFVTSKIIATYDIVKVPQEESADEEKEIIYLNGVRSIACYNKDGTGPKSECSDLIKCYSREHHNSDIYKITCPMF